MLMTGFSKTTDHKLKATSSYAVLVLYFTFRGNSSSVVKMSNMLMAVVAETLMMN